MYYATVVALLGKIVLKQVLKTQVATYGRGSTTPTSSTVSGELSTTQTFAVSSTLQSAFATIQPFNILRTMEEVPPGRPFFIYDYSPADTSPPKRQRRQHVNDRTRADATSNPSVTTTTPTSPATRANLPSITILTPSTVRQAAAALPMTAPPLASHVPSGLGTFSAPPTVQTLTFPGVGQSSGFLVMLPDPTELVLDFGALIHNHPDDNEDDELMLFLFEEDEPPAVSWTVTISMPPQTALPSPYKRPTLQQQLHAVASSGLGRSGGQKQYPAPVHAEPWLRHWVPIVLQRPATVIPEHERWDSARTILKSHQHDVMMQWYNEARRRMEAYYSQWWFGRSGGRDQNLYLSVETYETEPRMVGLLRSMNKLDLLVDAS
ncbi:MAG: hypothetical protein BYD32DRAFT_255671 [Podila humilis]|nr:MAG: hypothetical protein BYD32DRAFT_255671 [Podila humilis]